jgi:hypothetical protein
MGHTSEMNEEPKDWRIENARRTQGASFKQVKYEAPRPDWDHDHCAACWAKFMDSARPETLDHGYVTLDGKWWICDQCFNDLKGELDWEARS